jgi:hypothetical protein
MPKVDRYGRSALGQATPLCGAGFADDADHRSGGLASEILTAPRLGEAAKDKPPALHPSGVPMLVELIWCIGALCDARNRGRAPCETKASRQRG